MLLLLKDNGCLISKHASTSMDAILKFSKDRGEFLANVSHYRMFLGRL